MGFGSVQLMQELPLKKGADSGQGILPAVSFKSPTVLFWPTGFDPLGWVLKHSLEEVSKKEFSGHLKHCPLVMLKMGF